MRAQEGCLLGIKEGATLKTRGPATVSGINLELSPVSRQDHLQHRGPDRVYVPSYVVYGTETDFKMGLFCPHSSSVEGS